MAHALKMDFANPTAAIDRWYVTNGIVAVGPVAFELLTRGVAHGRIPPNSFIRHESWKVWRKLEDIDGLSAVTRLRTVEELGDLSKSAEARANNPFETPLPPAPDTEPAPAESGDTPRSVRPVAVDPVGVLASASDLDDAFLLALSTAVTASAAHVGLLHRVRPDLGSTITSCAQGPNSEKLLGEKLATNDPVLTAADAGHTVIGEPRLGDTGRYIAGRVGRCVPNPRGVAMVPVMHYGALIAIVELGRRYRPFRAREIARVEDVVEVLTERIVVTGWLD
jgi:hypothetical protein